MRFEATKNSPRLGLHNTFPFDEVALHSQHRVACIIPHESTMDWMTPSVTRPPYGPTADTRWRSYTAERPDPCFASIVPKHTAQSSFSNAGHAVRWPAKLSVLHHACPGSGEFVKDTTWSRYHEKPRSRTGFPVPICPQSRRRAKLPELPYQCRIVLRVHILLSLLSAAEIGRPHFALFKYSEWQAAAWKRFNERHRR